jgi:putative transposase
MRKSRFTESQIVALLKEGEAGVALSELTRKHDRLPALQLPL